MLRDRPDRRRLVAAAGLEVAALRSGPPGSASADRLDTRILDIDPLSAQPHDVEVKSLFRLAIPDDNGMAVNEATETAFIGRPRPSA